MQAKVLEAIQILDSAATAEDLHEACRSLFVESDLCTHSSSHPYDPSEVDAVANAISGYIENPDYAGPLREIIFRVSRPLAGASIEHCEFASIFSEDMLYQNLSTDFTSFDTDTLRRHLKTFLIGILFRYTFRVYEDRAAFPISMLLNYMDGVRELLSREPRESDLSRALWTTLAALASVERKVTSADLDRLL